MGTGDVVNTFFTIPNMVLFVFADGEGGQTRSL